MRPLYNRAVRIDHREEYELALAAAGHLRSGGFGDAAVAVQTGSGLAPPALEERRTIVWDELPGMPPPTAPGHRGALHHGLLRGVPTIVLEGRLHAYEGWTPTEVVRPVRALGVLGVRRLVLTNAVGGVREDLRSGDVVRILDHLNLTGADPLGGIHDPRFGDRFVVTAGRSHDAELGRLADEVAAQLGIPLHRGVYAGVPGPTFETPAQVRMLRALGADVVGMSTVHEVAAATQLGMSVLVLSFVANPAGVVASGRTAEEEVLAAGGTLGDVVARLVEEVVARLGPKGGS